MKDLLITIAAHYNPERVQYLERVIANFVENYKVDFDIIINTNTSDLEYLNSEKITVVVAENLEHPFHLTSLHRQHVKDNIDRYKVFGYFEDDMLLPFENYLNYLENFKLLYPKFVPSVIRIEEENGAEFVSDVIKQHKINIIEIGGKQFNEMPFFENYNAFWIMPAKELKEGMTDNFTKLTTYREENASFVGWALRKPTLLEIENGMVSKKCYSYHLPSNYIHSNMPNGKIKPENIFL